MPEGAPTHAPERGAASVGGTSSAGSTPGGGATGTGAGTGGSESPTASVPPKGQGWDEKFVYIGFSGSKDFDAAFAGTALASGDQAGDAQAIVAALNREGGLFGRQIKLFLHDSAYARTQSDPNGVGQENCSDFTQDRPVIAVVASAADSDALRACLAKARTVEVSFGSLTWDDEVARRYSPYYYHAHSPSVSRLVPLLLSRLNEQQYFTRWDTNTGGPSTAAAVKVGVLYGNDETGSRQGEALAAALEKAGYPTERFEYADRNNQAAAVLRFKASGVTHVTGTDLGMTFFVLAAKSQRYYPRLGIHSYMAPVNGFQRIARATREQLNGAVGVGWNQYVDANSAQDPGLSSGAKWCLDALAQGGQTFEKNDDDRTAQMVGLLICDGVRLPVRAAQAGGGLDPVAIRRGMLSIAREYVPAGAGFGVSGISETHFGLPGAARDLRYDNGCGCFVYAGGIYAL